MLSVLDNNNNHVLGYLRIQDSKLSFFITALVGMTGRDQQMAIFHLLLLQSSNGPWTYFFYKFEDDLNYFLKWKTT